MKRVSSAGLVVIVLAALLALVLPIQADFGTNWSVQFFPGKDLTTACPAGGNCALTGINGLNFNWGTGAPVVNGVTVFPADPQYNDNFSARFTSSQALAPGTYNFVVSSDDGVRVYINGALRLDKWVDRPLTTDTFTEVISTSPVLITVEYYENIDNAILQVQWFLQGAATPGFGTPLLTLTPLATAVPPLTVEVQNVRGLSIRTGPYLGASFVGVAVPGTVYTPIARRADEGGPYTWYLITAGDKTGWVSGRYLKFTGDPNSVPEQATIFEQIDDAPFVGVYAVPRSVMNFRRRPSQRSELLGQIAWGEQLELVGRTVQAGKNHWFQVRYNGQIGWIYAPFVSVQGDINAVPIR